MRINCNAAAGKVISATGTSANVAITMGDNDNAVMFSNTSATLYVAVCLGSSAPTAVLTTDLIIPPMGMAIVGANSAITHAAAIASGAGPTIVGVMPCIVED